MSKDMTVRIETKGETAIVVMDCPPVDAINRETRKGLLHSFGNLTSDPTIKRIILTGAGTAFAAGADAREFDLPPLEPHLPDVVRPLKPAASP